MNYDVVIGIEIHGELKTKSKMFSFAKNEFGNSPNTNVDCLDIAFPGTMPRVNKKAVELAIRASNYLNMEIDPFLIFDRKNYFYPDLPKGYQITQQESPIGKEGYLEIFDENLDIKKIEIERLHIEEDTAKQTHLKQATLLDYNRAGSPLIEIVSKPQINSPKQASAYVEVLKSVLTLLNISDGKMEEGSLRCDINISLKLKEEKKLGTKVEIKNMNSLSNIEKAITFEIKRQTKILDNNNKVIQQTRRFDEKKGETILMREKGDALDYKYFTEPNLTPLNIQPIIDIIKEEKKICLPFDRLKKYVKTFNLSFVDAKTIAFKEDVAIFFEKTIENNQDPNFIKSIVNLILSDVFGYLNKNETTLEKTSLTPKKLSYLVFLLKTNKINSKQAKEILNIIIKKESSIDYIINEKGFESISDKEKIKKIAFNIIESNPNLKKEYQNGKTNLLGFFVGQVLKQTKGKANPKITKDIVLELLN